MRDSAYTSLHFNSRKTKIRDIAFGRCPFCVRKYFLLTIKMRYATLNLVKTDDEEIVAVLRHLRESCLGCEHDMSGSVNGLPRASGKRATANARRRRRSVNKVTVCWYGNEWMIYHQSGWHRRRVFCPGSRGIDFLGLIFLDRHRI